MSYYLQRKLEAAKRIRNSVATDTVGHNYVNQW
jgi:hypothetical protein